MTPTSRDVAAYALGLSTLPALAAAVLVVDSRPARRMWAKRPVVVDKDFWGVRLSHRRATVWCRKCSWTITGDAATTTPAITRHRQTHLPHLVVRDDLDDTTGSTDHA